MPAASRALAITAWQADVMTRTLPMVTTTLADAQARFSSWIDRVEAGETVVITRHGRPAAALVSAQDLAVVRAEQAARPRRGLAALLADPVPGGDACAEALDHLVRQRSELPARALPFTDAT